MGSFRRRHLIAVVFEACIDLIYFFFTFLHKADMKAAGVFWIGSFHEADQSAVVVCKEAHFVICSLVDQAEVLFEKGYGDVYVCNRQVEVVEFHCFWFDDGTKVAVRAKVKRNGL